MEPLIFIAVFTRTHHVSLNKTNSGLPINSTYIQALPFAFVYIYSSTVKPRYSATLIAHESL